jgi:glycosyltransferase involved in cell wall biosynthesis
MGVADERRRLEDTIEAVQMLDGRFSLDLVLMRDNSYRRRLEALVAGDQLIRILPPVRQEEMLEFANQYDVGVFLLPARFPNQVHVLPNKLFDYIQARLAVAIGPSHEMAEVVRRWDCGVISDDFRPDSLAEALSKLTLAEVRRMKANADVAAGALNAEANQEVVLGVVAAALR